MIRWCGMPASTVLAAILELEIASRLTRHHGNRICLVIIRLTILRQKVRL